MDNIKSKLELAQKYMEEGRWAEAACIYSTFTNGHDNIYYEEYLTCRINALESDNEYSINFIENEIRDLVDVRLPHGGGFYGLLRERVEEVKRLKELYRVKKRKSDELRHENKLAESVAIFIECGIEGIPVSYFDEDMRHSIYCIDEEEDLDELKKVKSMLEKAINELDFKGRVDLLNCLQNKLDSIWAV